MESIVVTGADGFIGSHFLREAAYRGLRIYAVTVPNSPLLSRIRDVPNVEILQENLSDWAAFADKLPQNPIALLHLAWSGVSPESRGSMEAQLTNIPLCLDAVRLAARLSAHHFLLPGSTMEYAYCGQVISQSACPSPQNAYGAAKIAARYLCAALCEELRVPFVYAVVASIYGADRADSNVVYYTISELLQGRRPMLTKLEQRWDYVHIDDVVRALLLLAEHGVGGTFYGIGHGDNQPLSQYIYQIRDLIDPALPLGIGEVPYKDNRVPSSCIDITPLMRDTGFAPQVSFTEGIREVIARVREQMNRDGEQR